MYLKAKGSLTKYNTFMYSSTVCMCIRHCQLLHYYLYKSVFAAAAAAFVVVVVVVVVAVVVIVVVGGGCGCYGREL